MGLNQDLSYEVNKEEASGSWKKHTELVAAKGIPDDRS